MSLLRNAERESRSDYGPTDQLQTKASHPVPALSVRLDRRLEGSSPTEACRMRKAVVRWAPWAVGGTSIALMIGNLALLFVHRNARLPVGYSEGWNLGSVPNNAVNTAVPTIGIVLASRRPENRIPALG
ncbi:MAG: hypothetical protein QOH48_2438 [Actinomycetota bacterium]|jgi:hypothetical protein|nr:hypothetical protein [Actinomycetota bacterium]